MEVALQAIGFKLISHCTEYLVRLQCALLLKIKPIPILFVIQAGCQFLNLLSLLLNDLALNQQPPSHGSYGRKQYRDCGSHKSLFVKHRYIVVVRPNV